MGQSAELAPAQMPTTPPMVSHTARSVGEPVKKLETWELKESIAAMPNINRTIAATETKDADGVRQYDVLFTRERQVAVLVAGG